MVHVLNNWESERLLPFSGESNNLELSSYHAPQAPRAPKYRGTPPLQGNPHPTLGTETSAMQRQEDRDKPLVLRRNVRADSVAPTARPDLLDDGPVPPGPSRGVCPVDAWGAGCLPAHGLGLWTNGGASAAVSLACWATASTSLQVVR